MTSISSNKIFSQAVKQFWLTWLFALVWNALTWFAIIKGGDNILRAFDENPLFYFFVLFPFIGLWITISAILQTLAWHKFGKTPLILDPFPSRMGAPCAGHITLPVSSRKAAQATLSLNCMRSYIQRTSDGSSRREEAVWQDKITLKPDKYGKKIRLNFAFNPPANLPATEPPSNNYHFWRLQIRLPLPGIDYDRLFELPLEAADPQVLTSHNQFKSQTSAVIAHRDTEIGSVPKVSKTTSGTQFYYGYGRSKAMAISMMLVGIVIAAFGYFFFDGFFKSLPATIGLITTVVGLIALALFLLGIFIIATSLTVEIGITGIRKQQRIFGYLLEEWVEAKDIVKITTERNGSSTSGNTTRVWYKLSLLTRHGQTIEVGDSLEGQSFANEISEQMISSLGSTWQAATLGERKEQAKRPIPLWLRWVGKLASYSLVYTLLYDLSQMFPEITVFFAKLLP